MINLVNHPDLNHRIEVTKGVLAEECSRLISVFFKRRRAEKKLVKQKVKSELQAKKTPPYVRRR